MKLDTDAHALVEHDLQAVEARAAEALEAAGSEEGIDIERRERVLGTDVPALVAEVRRLRGILYGIIPK